MLPLKDTLWASFAQKYSWIYNICILFMKKCGNIKQCSYAFLILYPMFVSEEIYF